MMNAKARSLRMTDTIFRNASGLPDPEQITTAKDMAILARALQQHFPRRHHFFSLRSFKYRGRSFPSHNDFLARYKGAVGLKTGFTCKAGYNIVTAVERNDRSLIGVILGARNAKARNAQMVKLLNRAFSRKDIDEKSPRIEHLAARGEQGADFLPNTHVIADICLGIGQKNRVRKTPAWSLQVGVRQDKREALALATQIIRENSETLKAGRPLSIPFLRGVLLQRVCITDLERENAIAACQGMRKKEQYCIVMSPKALRFALKKGRIAEKYARRKGK
jgi:D-alanyl-D-alanine carboxypeptidase